MAIAVFQRPLLSPCGLVETCRRVNYATVAPQRGVLAGALHWGSRRLMEPNTFLGSFLVGCVTQRTILEGMLGDMRIAASRVKSSARRRSGRAGGVRGGLLVDGRWVEECWFPTFSSKLGCEATCDVTSVNGKRGNDGRGGGSTFLRNYRRTFGRMHGLGGILRYASTSSKWKDAGFVRSCHRTCSTEVDTSSRRSRNLETYGQNNITNERALSEIIRILQEDENLDVVKLGESCHVRLVVRRPGTDLFLGISVKAAKVTDAFGRYCFFQCRKSHNILNLCASLPSPVHKFFRWWLIPGEQLLHLKTDKVQINPDGKWARFEISQGKLANAVLGEFSRRIAYQAPLSEWSIPKSLTHQKELSYFSQMTQKVWAPLGCDVTNPPICHRSVDVIVDSVCMQSKTAYAHKKSRGLLINIRKHGGRDGRGKCTSQPYTIDDGIDAIIVNVQQRELLTGVFIFPAKEVIARGWFRGSYYPGKSTVNVFPSFVSPRKGYESTQQWQLEYYLDIGDEVDLNRARMLLDQCKSEKRENKKSTRTQVS